MLSSIFLGILSAVQNQDIDWVKIAPENAKVCTVQMVLHESLKTETEEPYAKRHTYLSAMTCDGKLVKAPNRSDGRIANTAVASAWRASAQLISEQSALMIQGAWDLKNCNPMATPYGQTSQVDYLCLFVRENR